MLRKILFILITAIFISTGVARAVPEDLILYDLSLAGYRLGMSFDEATEVRHFQTVRDRPGSTDGVSIVDAYIDQFYLDEIETSLWVSFRNGHISKIIVRFAPEGIDEMSQRLQKALGNGENKSRLLTNSAGKEMRQTVSQWSYPNGRISLIGISSNTEFATLGLVARRGAAEVKEEL